MISLKYLAFEVTRLCNEFCKMCMRGEAEDVNMTEDIVDRVLLDNCIQDVETIMFTGDEPTLNEKLICYIVELIMKHKIPVRHLSIVTNAKKFPKDTLEVFKDYQRYAKINNLTELEKKLAIGFMNLSPEIREAVFSVLENTFSNDRQNTTLKETSATAELSQAVKEAEEAYIKSRSKPVKKTEQSASSITEENAILENAANQ